MLCSKENGQHFRGTYRLHRQGQKVSQADNQQKVGLLLLAGLLLGLLFDPEHGDSM
jgi:hypothetical protein